jgi:hypothetical protein
MALEKDVNSFVTLADAQAYFENRLDVDAWTSATESQKNQALITATDMMCEMPWTGYVDDENQKLAFPRTGSYFDPKLGREVLLNSTPALTRLYTATFELAYHLLNNDGLLDDSGLVDDLKIGNIQLSKISNPNKVPGIVKTKLKPMWERGTTSTGASRSWWRAN